MPYLFLHCGGDTRPEGQPPLVPVHQGRAGESDKRFYVQRKFLGINPFDNGLLSNLRFEHTPSGSSTWWSSGYISPSRKMLNGSLAAAQRSFLLDT